MGNPVGIQGLAFIEFFHPEPSLLSRLFEQLGLAPFLKHQERLIRFYRQNEICFLLNASPDSFASRFGEAHGPSIPSMGWLVNDAAKAAHTAAERGAQPATGDYALPAVHGIGGSLIYFIDASTPYSELGFTHLETHHVPQRGFTHVDHLTNNVPQGTLRYWADFYMKVFGFTEIRYFDIKGTKTGLHSFALKSPCGTFSIPINEGTESKSQINEYLSVYGGAGIQHIALCSSDIIHSIEEMQRKDPLPLLDIDPSYYAEAFQRVPNIAEDKKKIEALGLLVDGDAKGYLLQIFTRNLVGPIFFEFIQRNNHQSFGEGNFGALFRSIERDQERRGVL